MRSDRLNYYGIKQRDWKVEEGETDLSVEAMGEREQAWQSAAT
ncbi:MAG TPA: hypothetical protein VE715_22465 [Blastocatellia bacterium]|nr:hypothetical protein [Blastocatellia bacterium]